MFKIGTGYSDLTGIKSKNVTWLNYDISTNCVVNRIRFQVDLNNKAYGKDDQIVDRCVESLESAGYVQTDVRNEFLHRGYSYKVSVRNSSGSISLDFSIY